MSKKKIIYVVCEVDVCGSFTNLSKQIISKANEFAVKLDCNISIIIMSLNAKVNYDDCYGHSVYIIHYDDSLYTFHLDALLSCIDREMVLCILMKDDPIWKMIATGCACTLDGGLIADCIDISVNENQQLIFKRIAFSGNKQAEIVSRKNYPSICTIKEDVFDEMMIFNNVPIFFKEVYARQKLSGINVCGCISKESCLSIDFSLKNKRIIFGIGKGVSRPAIQSLKMIAAKLGAGFGYSKPLIDAGYDNQSYQIGHSGSFINCDLYIAVGISGSIHHICALQKCKYIVAINHDEDAPIFKYADLCIKSDSDVFTERLFNKLMEARC